MVEIDWDILEDELDRETLDEPDGETLDKNQVWDTLDVAEIELECDLKDHYHDRSVKFARHRKTSKPCKRCSYAYYMYTLSHKCYCTNL